MRLSTKITPKAHPAFQRDALTWLSYGMLGYFSYLMTIPGPIMPFLRAELNLNYTLASFHFSAFALGMMLAGLTADRITRRFKRYFAFWGGAIGIALGGLGLALSKQVTLTLLSTLSMGFTGGVLLVTIQATLSDHHQANRNLAITEANVAASLCAILAPLSIGGLVQAGLDWRLSLFLVLGLVVVLFLKFRARSIPQPRQNASLNLKLKGGMPKAFWAYWLVVFFSVAVEWCMSYWGSDFLEKTTDLSKSTASLTLSLYFLAMLLGRLVGSWATRLYPGTRLLLLATGMAALGFPLFWLAPTAPLKILGLFIAGFGIANLYPLTLVAALNVVPEVSAWASARLSLGIGLAMLLAPLLLGWTADQISIQNAYGLVAGFLAMIALMTLLAAHLNQPSALFEKEEILTEGNCP